MECSTLKIDVSDTVEMNEMEFTARGAEKSIKSPYFQPRFSFKDSSEMEWDASNPRGPTIFIDMDLGSGGFE